MVYSRICSHQLHFTIFNTFNPHYTLFIAGAKAPTSKTPITEGKRPVASEAVTATTGDGEDMKTILANDDPELSLPQ